MATPRCLWMEVFCPEHAAPSSPEIFRAAESWSDDETCRGGILRASSPPTLSIWPRRRDEPLPCKTWRPRPPSRASRCFVGQLLVGRVGYRSARSGRRLDGLRRVVVAVGTPLEGLRPALTHPDERSLGDARLAHLRSSGLRARELSRDTGAEAVLLERRRPRLQRIVPRREAPGFCAGSTRRRCARRPSRRPSPCAAVVEEDAPFAALEARFTTDLKTLLRNRRGELGSGQERSQSRAEDARVLNSARALSSRGRAARCLDDGRLAGRRRRPGIFCLKRGLFFAPANSGAGPIILRVSGE